MSLMMGSQEGDRVVTLDDVAAVEVPPATDTYCPVAHEALITLARETAQGVLGLPAPASEEYGLSQHGKQMFGVMRWDKRKHDDFGFALAMRNSYNYTLAAAIAGGGNVFACSNLQLYGDKLHVMRKHTLNVWADLPALLEAALVDAMDVEDIMAAHFAAMRQVEIPQVMGHALLGVALGQRVLRPQQATVAYKAWDEDWHDAGRSHWGLLQAMTQGTKRGAAGQSMSAHTGAYGFVLGQTRSHVTRHPTTIDAEVLEAFTEVVQPAALPTPTINPMEDALAQ